jgi:ketosteroid isomerase-like protein
MEPLSGRDQVALFHDEEAMDTLRHSLKRLASDELVTEFVGDADGFTGTFKGIDGFIEGWRDFSETFEHLVTTITEVLPLGDKVVVLSALKGKTATGGVEMAKDSAGVFTFEDGELKNAGFFLDRKAALRAAGVNPG